MPEDLIRISVNNMTDDFKDNPPKGSAGFTSRVIVLDHLGQIVNKYTEEVDCHFTFIARKIAQIKKLLSRQSVQDCPPGVNCKILDRKQTAAASATNPMNFMNATGVRYTLGIERVYEREKTLVNSGHQDLSSVCRGHQHRSQQHQQCATATTRCLNPV